MSPITAKTYTTEVICLRTYDFGEADKVLHLYSPEHGRISAVAKGVKKAKSKLAGACEPLNISEVQLSKGKNLDLLCQYQPRETFSGIRSDLMKLAYGLLYAELVNLLALDADSHLIFQDFKQALYALDHAPEELAPVLGLMFQLALLQSAGYHPVLDACVFTDQPLDLDAVYYCFSAQVGGVTLPEQRRKHQAATGGFGEQWVNISTSTLQLLSHLRQDVSWSPAQLLKAQKFVAYYFKQVFEKPIHSYELVLSLLETDAGALHTGTTPVVSFT